MYQQNNHRSMCCKNQCNTACNTIARVNIDSTGSMFCGESSSNNNNLVEVSALMYEPMLVPLHATQIE